MFQHVLTVVKGVLHLPAVAITKVRDTVARPQHTRHICGVHFWERQPCSTSAMAAVSICCSQHDRSC